jgi:ferredoxin
LRNEDRRLYPKPGKKAEPDRSTSLKIQKARLVYFSPTITTKAILESIAEGMRADAVKNIDVTLPNVDRHNFPEMENDEVLVIGSPVYAGRIPEIAVRRFQKLKSKGNPAVIVVLYGNREYEDALLELSDLATAAGFVPIAGSAFIGEHSFSTESTPLAKGRPDASDIRCAREFGASVGQLLQSVHSFREIRSLKLPGNRPFKEHANLPKASPFTENDRCTACGTCAAACPSGSISINETSSTNAETCILCCACVKVCPENARTLKDPNMGKITEWLYVTTAKRKEPQVFLGRDSL